MYESHDFEDGKEAGKGDKNVLNIIKKISISLKLESLIYKLLYKYCFGFAKNYNGNRSRDKLQSSWVIGNYKKGEKKWKI